MTDIECWNEIKYILINYRDLSHHLPNATGDHSIPSLRAEFERLRDNLNLVKNITQSSGQNYDDDLWKYVTMTTLVSLAVSFSIGSMPQMRS